MTTKTTAIVEVTVQDLVTKLVDEKLDHIHSILHYEYGVRITQVLTSKESKVRLVVLESEVHNGDCGVMCYTQDVLLQCDAEDEADRILHLFEGKIDEVNDVSTDEAVDEVRKFLQQN
ncbi:hypothetical protein [Alicyclobacillus sp. ALC3]|uniref:hypothetical protein n=1 Tax=Alicyclobacillus sp. ALC3 TaxID=2796143 RepID=UPI002378802B|nr:hypothetical protein [Alicyclobacillus sp. ALC3]WDL98847.1 hypothetical protein JC200_09435 [Alicyclobacillus sp. ALC3]